MNKIKVSVIIPVYNAQSYLENCLDSVLTQTLKEIEIICIDDGSTDASCELIKKYSERYANVIALHQENQGAGPARNKGIDCAHGQYVCFIDADDYYADNDVLELLYTEAERNQVLACGGNLVNLKETGKIEKRRNWFQGKKRIQFEEYGDLYYYTCFIFDLKTIRENGIAFPPYRRYQDPPFLLNVMGHMKEFYAVEEIVYVYREGHKEIKYDFNKVCDLLRGVRDCCRLAQEYHFVKTYKDHLKNALSDYFPLLYPYAKEKNPEVWELIDEINGIGQGWMGETFEPLSDWEHMEKFVEDLQQNWRVIVDRCRRAKEVVIYGAGEAGKAFLQAIQRQEIPIVGFAVSNTEKEDFVEGYRVKAIQSYSREALVVVAVGEKYAEEVLRNLEVMQFPDSCYMRYKDFFVLEKIRESH